jgi:hypothetical protein
MSIYCGKQRPRIHCFRPRVVWCIHPFFFFYYLFALCIDIIVGETKKLRRNDMQSWLKCMHKSADHQYGFPIT